MLPWLNAPDLMLASLARGPFSREGWLFEIKYDGYRALVKKDGDDIALVSRNGKSLNSSFPDIVAAIEAVPGSFIWDAELTVDDANGLPSFERLQRRARSRLEITVRTAARDNPARLYVFDILVAGRQDVRRLRLEVASVIRTVFREYKWSVRGNHAADLIASSVAKYASSGV